MQKLVSLTLLLGLFAVSALGCSSAGPRKYVLFGEHVAEEVELFEDFWSDYPFKPDDPELALRRGKGGVIRFYKKNSYTRSIMVDGDLTVNVYYSVDDGVTLTQPDAQLVMTSEELNQKHRKFDKKFGYSYHVYLDLGEYDQPVEEITILSIFKDAKSGKVTLSKEIRTTTMGTTPLNEDKHTEDDSSMASAARRWAQKQLGDDTGVHDPIAALQEKYSNRKRVKFDKEEASKDTRLRDVIDIDDSRFENIDEERSVAGASYLEEQQARHDAAIAHALAESREKSAYYREQRRRQTEEYLGERASQTDSVSSLRDSPNLSSALNFKDQAQTCADFQEATSRHFNETSSQLERRASEEYAKGPTERLSAESPYTPGHNLEKSKESSKRIGASSNSSAPEGFSRPKGQQIVDLDNLRPSEMDRLDDFQPDVNAPNTEIYTRDN